MFSLKFIEKIKNRIFPFYKNSDLRFIFKKLDEGSSDGNNTVMFVGGCVRKYLLNQNIDDIDIATTLTIDEVKERLKDTKIKILDTGVKHGTITLISKKTKLEITTLRKDINTDGRHAEIVYTDNWKEDSNRRDITINAIYLDIKGKIYDFQNGVEHLKKNIVKFIGNPSKRIQEDYLRIIRFLRFAIQYDSITDIDTINALKLNLDGVKTLSKERISDELFKILKLKNFDNILKHKNKKKIFSLIFPEFKNLDRIKKLKYFKNSSEFPSLTLILGILLFDNSNNYEYFCYKYKTSNKISSNLTNLFKLYNDFKSNNNFLKKNLTKNIYYYGTENIKNVAKLHFFEKSKISINELNSTLKKIQEVKIPKFNYDGLYLKSKGMKEGEKIGKTLKLIEREWLSNNFNISENKITEIINTQKDQI